jgi:hypothetical protein
MIILGLVSKTFFFIYQDLAFTLGKEISKKSSTRVKQNMYQYYRKYMQTKYKTISFLDPCSVPVIF